VRVVVVKAVSGRQLWFTAGRRTRKVLPRPLSDWGVGSRAGLPWGGPGTRSGSKKRQGKGRKEGRSFKKKYNTRKE